jgi:hypothetical protein
MVRLVEDIRKGVILGDSMMEKIGKKTRKEESSYSLFVDLAYRCVYALRTEECL